MGVKEDPELRTEQFVLGPDGSWIPLEQLPPEEYRKFCRWLCRSWLAALFAGEADFPEED